MSDQGTRFTDARQAALEKKIERIYKEAQKEILEKLKKHERKKTAMMRVKEAQVKAGTLSQAEYDRWLAGQEFIGKQWKDKAASIAETLKKANEQANALVEGEKRVVFGENATFQAYQLEHDAGVDLSFTPYDSATVSRLIKDDPELLPRKVVNGKKDIAWNKRGISNAVTQGIIQGESVDEIAKRIAKQTSSSNMKAMKRYARTAMTGAQNAGRMEMLHNAQDMGIKVKKRWLATLDGRTRDAHQELDGQVRDVDEPFDSALGKIMYPGDMHAAAGNIWNCRCALVYVYDDYPNENAQRRDNIDGELIEDMSFEEWKEKKKPDLTKKRTAKKKNRNANVSTARGMGTRAKKAEVVYEINSREAMEIEEQFDRAGVEKRPFSKLSKQLSTDEIIKKIGGGDMTKGSCTSAAYAYIGNKAGYDVYDFRGGASQDIFQRNGNVVRMAKLDNVESFLVENTNDFKAVGELVKNVVEGKEYLLSAGEHTAIIRKVSGHFEYLELQDPKDNGYKVLNNTVLKDRFGCKTGRTFAGIKLKITSELIDAETLGENKEFVSMLQYVNSGKDKQMKGVKGYAK